MFDKEKKGIKIEYSNNEFYKIGDVLITPSFGITLNKYHNDKKIQEANDYQDSLISYQHRKLENGIKKLYNPKIQDLYNNGSLRINNDEYNLKEFYIIFDDKENNFHLMCTNPRYQNKEYNYNKAVKFIDTTAFINLVNNANILIRDNIIIINNLDLINNLVSNWDGYIHNETKETDAIINKKMIRDDNGE